MKIKNLTQSQKKKVEKIDALLTQLREEGVYPYTFGGGGSCLVFLRHDKEDTDEICDLYLAPHENYKEYEKLIDKEYIAENSRDNIIEIIGL